MHSAWPTADVSHDTNVLNLHQQDAVERQV